MSNSRNRIKKDLGPVRSSQSSSSNSRKGSRGKKSNSKDERNVPWYCQGCDEAIDMQDFDSIECARCKEWWHKRCSNLDRDEFRVAQKGNSLLSYHCINCKNKKGSDEEPSRMEVKLDKMFDMFDLFTKKMLSMEAQNEQLHVRVDKVEDKIESEVDKKVREIFEEEREKERRRPNAIVVNIPESSNPDIDERIKEDKEAVLKVLEDVMDEKVAPSEVENPMRLGVRRIGSDSKPRVLKITLANEMFRKKLFGKTKKFNEREGDPKKKIYVNPDRTHKERDAYKKLKMELKERQKTDPNLCIFRMQIVRRPPQESSDGMSQAQLKGNKRKVSDRGSNSQTPLKKIKPTEESPETNRREPTDVDLESEDNSEKSSQESDME